MTRPGEALAGAAEALVGTPFRLHGRDPATGLDCIGLVGTALAACGYRVHVPEGYGLRNARIDRFLAFAPRNGLHPATGPTLPGDVVLTVPGPAQHHLMVALGAARAVHAHAGLRRTVAQTFPTPFHALRRWRIGANPEQTWQR